MSQAIHSPSWRRSASDGVGPRTSLGWRLPVSALTPGVAATIVIVFAFVLNAALPRQTISA
jgi:hypothetical protein